jgi:hypothetical protein
MVIKHPTDDEVSTKSTLGSKISMENKDNILLHCIKKIHHGARHWWLTPVILVTQEAEIRRIVVQSQPREIVRETLS